MSLHAEVAPIEASATAVPPWSLLASALRNVHLRDLGLVQAK
jgi:hypothetical protein